MGGRKLHLLWSELPGISGQSSPGAACGYTQLLSCLPIVFRHMPVFGEHCAAVGVSCSRTAAWLCAEESGI